MQSPRLSSTKATRVLGTPREGAYTTDAQSLGYRLWLFWIPVQLFIGLVLSLPGGPSRQAATLSVSFYALSAARLYSSSQPRAMGRAPVQSKSIFPG